MNPPTHLEELKRKQLELERLENAEHFRSDNELELAALKRKKLRLKDEILRLSGTTKYSPNSLKNYPSPSPADLSLTERLPLDGEIVAADQLRQIIKTTSQELFGARKLQIREPDGGTTAEIILTPALSDMLLDLLSHIAEGKSVSLMPIGEMLTTQQAADILNVSRPYLVKLVDNGTIPCSRTGRHRRIKAVDLFDYKRRRDKQRSKALSELAEMDGDLL